MNPFFDTINNFWEKTTPVTVEGALATHRSVLRIVSFQGDSIDVAAKVNNLSRIPEWAKAYCLFYMLPHRRARPKKLPRPGVEKTEKQIEQLDKVQRAFNVSDKHAEQIQEILKANGVSFGE